MIQGSPTEIHQRKTRIESLRTVSTPLDIITEGSTPGDDSEKATEIVRSFAEVGVTWWIEAVWNKPYEMGGLEGMRTRIRQGPPQVE